jgi:hypothetical protein
MSRMLGRDHSTSDPAWSHHFHAVDQPPSDHFGQPSFVRPAAEDLRRLFVELAEVITRHGDQARIGITQWVGHVAARVGVLSSAKRALRHEDGKPGLSVEQVAECSEEAGTLTENGLISLIGC